MERPSVAVLIPAFNAEATLPACLAAIAALNTRPAEVIVYIDGARDRTEAIARAAGGRVLVNDGAPRGPAYGRNAAAAVATADYLLLIDADVVVAPDALDLLLDDAIRYDAAAFGSYDDRPDSQRVTSIYANLRHHFVHQHSARDATTFWSGLGLIARRQFDELGGFDAELFRHPSIEDIELGTRLLAAQGRVRLVPEAMAKHWKDWTLYRVWHTDIVRRAYPWACLIADGRTRGADLNVSGSERAKATVALVIPLLALAALFMPMLWPGAAGAVLLYLLLNRAFFVFLARRLSLMRLVVAVWMHWCYHIYATATYVAVMLITRLGLRSRGNAPEAGGGKVLDRGTSR